MISDDRLHRSRSTALILPDIRQLRLALGLSLAEGADLVKETPSLLASQESEGHAADRQFVDDTTDAYLAHALTLVCRGALPPMLPTDGTATAIWRFRMGLGLSPSDAAGIVGTRWWDLEALEGSTRGAGPGERETVWRSYAQWAARRRRREAQSAARRAAAGPAVTTRNNPFGAMDAERDRAAMLKLAYTPQVSAAEAEAIALKYLGVE